MGLNKHIIKILKLKFKYRVSGVALFCTSLIILFSSCQKEIPPHLKFVPSDASLVVAIDMKQITLNTLGLSTIFSKEFLNLFKDEKVRELITESGIDLMAPVYAFSVGQLEPKDPEIYSVFSISNAFDFEEYITKNLSGTQVTNETDYRYVIGKGFIIGWREGYGVFLRTSESTSKVSLKTKLAYILNLPDGSSLYANDQRFRAVIDYEKDVVLWGNLGYLKEIALSRLSQFGAATSLMTDSYLMAGVDFYDGKMEVNLVAESENKGVRRYAPLMQRNYNKQLLALVPNNPYTVASVCIDLETLGKFLEDNKRLITLNRILFFIGLSADDLNKMLTGNFVLAILDETGKSKTENSILSKYFKKTFLVVEIKNQKMLNAYIKSLEQQDIIRKHPKGYYTVFDDSLFLFNNGSNLIFSASVSAKNHVLNLAKTTEQSPNFWKELNDGFVYVYLNKEAVATKIPETFPDFNLPILTTKNAPQLVELSLKQFSEDRIEGGVTIRFPNENENSLLPIIRISQQISN